MNIETMIKFFVSFIGEYLFKPAKAAKYAKWFLRIRDYLLLLFPIETYPEQGLLGTAFEGMTADKVAVPVSAVHEATKTKGFSLPFNLPFVDGM